jgi:hypothetical protein
MERFKKEAFDSKIGFVKDKTGGKILNGLVSRRQAELDLFESSNRQRQEETISTVDTQQIQVEELEDVPQTRQSMYSNRYIKK